VLEGAVQGPRVRLLEVMSVFCLYYITLSNSKTYRSRCKRPIKRIEGTEILFEQSVQFLLPMDHTQNVIDNCARACPCARLSCYYFLHGLINHIGTKAKCRHLNKLTCKGTLQQCLSEFIDWKYSQSCWYFRLSFVNCCPSNLLSGSTLPSPPFPV
jgi:hypothetical protein